MKGERCALPLKGEATIAQNKYGKPSRRNKGKQYHHRRCSRYAARVQRPPTTGARSPGGRDKAAEVAIRRVLGVAWRHPERRRVIWSGRQERMERGNPCRPGGP